MKTDNKRYIKTIIDHNIRRKLLITIEQYVFLDCIYNFNCKKKYQIDSGDFEDAIGFFTQEEAKKCCLSLKNSELINISGTKIQTTDLWNIHFQKNYFIEGVINFMNDVIKTSYKTDSKVAVKFITARQKEGYVFEDFEDVILSRRDEWYDDDQMKQYLRPETLFGSKFESYLQHARINKPKKVNPKMDGMQM